MTDGSWRTAGVWMPGADIPSIPLFPRYPPPSTSSGSSGQASRSTLNRASLPSGDRYATIAAEGAVIPIVYGRDKVGGMVFAVAVDGDSLVLGVAWCIGEVEAVESVLINGAAPPTGVTVTDYLGTTGQGIDSTLAAAISGYADTLTGSVYGTVVSVAYSVIVIPTGLITGFPRIEGIIQGLNVYDPRVPSTAYSTNPALALADFLSSTVYGAGRTVDWTSVDAAADACDEVVTGGGKRRELGLALQRSQDIGSWIETLRTYAGVFVVDDGGTLYLIPDRPASVSRALDMSDVIRGSLSVSRTSTRDAPTVVRVVYTEEEGGIWKDAPAVARATGVDTGTVPWRESVIRLPGIHTHAQALREATERLNKFYLYDLSVSFSTFNDGLQDLRGDVVTLTHDTAGLAAKKFRISSIIPRDTGSFDVELIEYDEAAYSDSIEASPTYADTSLPDPSDVPAITGLTLVEEVYQLQSGAYGSRIRVTWTGISADYPYNKNYEWQVFVGLDMVWSGISPDEEAVSGALQEDQSYRVQVRAIASLGGAVGDWVDDTITSLGKQLPPGDVSSINGFEVGGEVRLSWLAAIDIDIWRYEIRYGTTGGTWATATLIDRVDTLRTTTREVAIGTWRFYVKAVDSVGNYSTNAAYIDIEVTLDAGAFFVGEQVVAYSAADSTRIHEMTIRDQDNKYYSWIGTAVGTLWPNAMDTYTNPLATDDDGNSSEWISDSWDVGSSLSGTWQIDVQNISALNGTIDTYLELSPDDSTWTSYSTTSTKETARYARVKVTAASSNTLLVDGDVTIRLDVVPREETGTTTSSASAATTISLDNKYSSVKAIEITPGGTAARTATYDNIVLSPTATNTFDVYIFDVSGSGTQVANEFYWRFLGI